MSLGVLTFANLVVTFFRDAANMQRFGQEFGFSSNMVVAMLRTYYTYIYIYTIFILCIYIYHVCINTQTFAPTFSSTQANIQYMEHLGYVVLPVSILSAISGSARFLARRAMWGIATIFISMETCQQRCLNRWSVPHRNH